MKYSIVFLEYDPEGINRKTTLESLRSVIDHSSYYDFELIHVKNVRGFVHAVNEGLTRSKGEYIVFVANDVIINDVHWLEKFSRRTNSLGGWKMTQFFMTKEARPDFACWCITRDLYEKVGLMDVRFAEGYGFDDDDYVFRVREAGGVIYDAGVELTHLECLTYTTVFKESKERMTSRNQSLFYEKWHDKYELKT